MRTGRGELLAVYLGGCAGALARSLLGEAVPHEPAEWPWATLAANVGGAFLLGLLVARDHARLPLLGAGFCGALTTFSTFQLELLQMLDSGRVALAAAYAGASIAAGMLAAGLAARR